MYDLLIKGGRLIDPAQKVDGIWDIVLTGDRIEKVAANIAVSEAKKIFDAAGKIVTPGLIDMHTHVYDAVLDGGANPDDAGVNQGVTTVMDCGSAGYATFGGFPKFVIPAARTTVYCYLHIGSFGISAMPELWYPEEINTAATEATIAAHPGLIRGVKLRLVGKLVASRGAEIVKIAKAAARKFGLPFMIHIGDKLNWVPASVTKEMLPLMEAGDTLTHIYTSLQGGILQADGRVLPEYIEAGKRGVILDCAHGNSNFSYAVARKMIAQGFLPDTISTDLTKTSLPGPVYGLTVSMSKFMGLGLSLEQLIPMVTVNPARVIGIADKKGSLKPGMDADISVLEIKTGRWQVADSNKEQMVIEKLITPVMTVKAGVLISPHPAAQPPTVA
jgi:dihydroorotase